MQLKKIDFFMSYTLLKNQTLLNTSSKMGSSQSTPPVPQDSPTLEKLIGCFRAGNANDIVQICGLIKKGVMTFDKSCTFKGSITIEKMLYGINKLQCSSMENFFKKSTLHDSGEFVIDGVKPYLLAYVMTIQGSWWFNVFKVLCEVSDVSVNDKIFGVTFFEWFLRGTEVYSPYRDSKFNAYDKTVSRQLLKGVRISKMSAQTFSDPIWHLIKTGNYALLEDIFEVADWKDAMKTNYLCRMAEISNVDISFAKLLITHTNAVFEAEDGKEEYCFVKAARHRNYYYLLFFLTKYNIIPKFKGGCIFQFIFSSCNWLTVNLVKEIINAAKKHSVDVINVVDEDGKTALWVLCEMITPGMYKGKTLEEMHGSIRELIFNGADIKHAIGSKKLLDVLLGKGLYTLANLIVDWQEEYQATIRPPAPPMVVPGEGESAGV